MIGYLPEPYLIRLSLYVSVGTRQRIYYMPWILIQVRGIGMPYRAYIKPLVILDCIVKDCTHYLFQDFYSNTANLYVSFQNHHISVAG